MTGVYSPDATDASDSQDGTGTTGPGRLQVTSYDVAPELNDP